MKVTKRIISILLTVVMLVSVMAVAPFTVSAASTAESLINVAKAEVGNYNYSKYNGHAGAWCHDFVSWCAQQSENGDVIPITSSCGTGANWFQNRGQWRGRDGYTPKAGDIIYFGWYNHVGIVTGCSNGRVYTIEGNALNCVLVNGGYSNGYSVNDSNISGYGVPAYNGQQPTEQPVDIGTDFYASISHLASWKHLTVDSNNNVVLKSDTNIANQYWKFYRQYDGSYKIVSALNDKCLDVYGGSNSDGANVQVWENNDSDAQRWYLYKNGNVFQLKPKCSNCVLEMNAWNFYEGVNIVCGTKDNSEAEIFSINFKDYNDIADTNLMCVEDNGVVNFSWKTPRGACYYNIKIFNGNSVWNSEAPINLCNVQGNTSTIDLGEGTFTAYLETFNAILDYHQCDPITFSTTVYEYNPIKTMDLKGHIYELYDKPVSWETAKKVCDSKNGHLATVTSQEEQDLITELISYGERKYYSLGATNINNVDKWEWITGEPMNYTKWADGEPNNVLNIERYLSAISNPKYLGLWNDTSNASTSGVSYGFICEFEPQCILGDINLDGEISILDATEIQKHIAQLITLDEAQLAVADTDGDGEINIIDATQIQKYLAEIIDKLG